MNPDGGRDATRPGGQPLELLFERAGLPRFELPPELEHGYGGGIGFQKPCFFANFVASLDGVVALPGDRESGQIVSQSSVADRFVMGILRACADTVIVGAGTFRRSPSHLWIAETIYPAAAPLFAETRRRLGLSDKPRFVLVSGSGNLDPSCPALANATIVTTPVGERALRGRLAPAARLEVLDAARVRFSDVLGRLHTQGAELVLTEGGPSLLAEAVAEKLVDELFLTSSPILFGRYAGDGRKSLADGADLDGLPLELLGARRHGSHLFLRYRLPR